MGTRTGQSILDRAWIKAQDLGVNKRWTAEEGLLWINDWQIEVVNALPRAYILSATARAQPGTRQTLGGLGLTTGLQPLDIPYNVSSSGAIGSPITKVKRAFLDEALPTWHQTQETEAQHWTTDEEDPKAFYVTPAIAGGGSLRVIYSAVPPDLTSLSDPIALDDVFANSGQFFVLFSFFSKDIASIKSTQMAQMHYQLFQQSIGVRDQKLAMSEAKSNNQQRGAA